MGAGVTGPGVMGSGVMGSGAVGVPAPTARHTINDGLVLDPNAGTGCVPIAGLDPEIAAGRVAAAGGSAPLFRHLLRRALGELGRAATADDVRTVGIVAAWRAGLYAARVDALRRIEAAVRGEPGGVAAVAAALGIPSEESVRDFCVAQGDNPFATFENRCVGRVIARVGGFRGVGGPWLEPPARPAVLPELGRMVVSCGAQRWIIDADLFGHVIRPAPPDEQLAAVEVASTGQGPRYRPVVSDLSYLVTIVDTGTIIDTAPQRRTSGSGAPP